MSEGLFWRILIAVLTVVFVWLLIPPVFRLLGVDPSADLLLVLKICIAAIALFYIIRGYPPGPRP